MRFTATQSDAIKTRNKNLLVSAGAGSGKTTVLTRRLIERILAGDSVTDFLVVTFMKAAASDIKRKLYDALVIESARDPENKHLYRQTLLVSEANICTISSYCISLVKENFAVLGISPRVRVIDGTENTMILRTVIDDLIKRGYEEENKAFLLLADNFSGDKNDSPLANTMIDLFEKLRVMLDREKMLLTCAEKLRSDADKIAANGFFSTESGAQLQKRLAIYYEELLDAANEMYSFAAANAEDDSYLAPIESIVEKTEFLVSAVEGNYVNFCSRAHDPFKGITLAKKGCDAETREIVRMMKSDMVKTADRIAKRYCHGNEELIASSFRKTADIICAINWFLNELEREFIKTKIELGVLDFTDFEQKALELLETTDENGNPVPTELCLRKQNGFKEILIDEYQDVNPMQDRIFALLAGGSNRFMVGDVKQSIYRFRNAYPDIFLGYKEEYPPLSESGESRSARIFLRENFRCSQSIINYVNYLFENVTKDSEYYREYDGEWLVHASDRFEKNHPVVLAVSKKEVGLVKEARRNEAEYIAREILRLVNSETSDDGTEYKFSDFAVMMSAMKGHSIDFEKAFRKYGIPYRNEKSENFLENPVICLAVSALKAIDDPTDDISLCSLMRSPVFNFTSDELYRIRLRSPKTSFWNAVQKSAMPCIKDLKNKKFRFKTRSGSFSLCASCRDFAKKLSAWREESIGVPCSDFLKGFFVSSGLLRISASNGSRSSLLLLFDYANKYENSQSYGLSGFIDYIDELSSTGKEISDAVQSGESDAVSFITVHKSKGLEYKVCFVVNADKLFGGSKNNNNNNNIINPITLIRREGVFFRLRDRTRFVSYDPICNILAADKERDQAVGEELRKLYVALTRAKERLYITGCAHKEWRNKIYSPSSAQSWLDQAIFVSQLGEKNFLSVVDIHESEGEAGYLPVKKHILVQPTREMLEIAKFDYPHSAATQTSAKISVSELREGLLEDDEYNRSMLSVPSSRVAMKPAFASEHRVDAGDIGTANHLFMQFCDFENVEKHGVEAESERLLSMKMFTPLQKEMLDVKALEGFFKSDLYSRIKASPRVYREKRFSVRDILSENGESVLVQGVIDCFFENPDGSFTVVDYKTDRVKTLTELADRHKLQLSCYCRAVERMTGRKVSMALLYSFALGSEVEVR